MNIEEMKPGYAKMLQTLYDHEISFRIIVQWDGGFKWSLGWNPEFECIANGNTRTAAECIERIWEAALNSYPEKTRKSLLEAVWKHD